MVVWGGLEGGCGMVVWELASGGLEGGVPWCWAGILPEPEEPGEQKVKGGLPAFLCGRREAPGAFWEAESTELREAERL